jgi:hypothetical protein
MSDLPLIDVTDMTWNSWRGIGLPWFSCNATLRHGDQGLFDAARAACQVERQRPFQFGDRPGALPRRATQPLTVAGVNY